MISKQEEVISRIKNSAREIEDEVEALQQEITQARIFTRTTPVPLMIACEHLAGLHCHSLCLLGRRRTSSPPEGARRVAH